MNSLMLLAFVTAAGNAFAGNPHICGTPGFLGQASLNDSVREIAVNGSSTLAAAITEIASFPDIQNYVNSIPGANVCVSGIAVGRNIYQYDEFLIFLEVTSPSGEFWAFPMLFQASSIQAVENIGAKPWLGFSGADLLKQIRLLLPSDFTMENLPQDFSPVNYLAKIFPTNQPISSGSRSYIHVPGLDPEWNTYLVSQLRSQDTGNPFTSQAFLDTGVVQIKGGQVRYSALPSFFATYTGMEGVQNASEPSNSSDAAHMAALKALSITK